MHFLPRSSAEIREPPPGSAPAFPSILPTDGRRHRQAHGIAQTLPPESPLRDIMISPLPPMLFIPSTATPRWRASGTPAVSKLRKVASRQFSGICTVSNGKSCGQHFQMDAGSLWPVKPMPAPCPAASPGATPRPRRRARRSVRIVLVDHLVNLPHVQMVGLQSPQ